MRYLLAMPPPAHPLRPYLVVFAFFSLLWFMRRAAGRLAPRAALAPLGFLITRWPVLIAWAAGATGMGLLMVSGARAHGHGDPSTLLMLFGIAAFSGLGAAVPLVGVPFFIARSFTPAPKLELEPGEQLLREQVANHFLGGEARGGKLLITNRRLAFRPHRFNVQLGTFSVALDQIRELAIEGSRFLVVTTNAPKPEWIVTWNPGELARFLEGFFKQTLPAGASVPVARPSDI